MFFAGTNIFATPNCAEDQYAFMHDASKYIIVDTTAENTLELIDKSDIKINKKHGYIDIVHVSQIDKELVVRNKRLSPDYGFFVEKIRFDIPNKKSQTLNIVHYSCSGKSLHVNYKPEEWKEIFPYTAEDAVYKKSKEIYDGKIKISN